MMNPKNKRLFFTAGLGFVLLLSMACVVSGNNSAQNDDLAATQEALSQTQIALSVQQTVQAQSTALPTAEIITDIPTIAVPDEPPVNCTPIGFQGISFCYDPVLASDVSASMEAAMTSEMDEAFSLPERYNFEFVGYQLSPTFHTPAIQIIPVQAYGNISPTSMQVIQKLQSVLNNQPESQDSMPFLPQWNAAQMFVSKVGYVSFQNGKGVRYLTQYGQSYYPITNNTLFYAFQGLTDDGQYFVSAVLPISHADLPADGDAYPGSMDDLMNNFVGYIADMRTQLNNQPDGSFSPGITTLDSMMQSFMIQP